MRKRSKISIPSKLNRLKRYVLVLVNRGMSPEKLALTISIGFVLGLFPMIGITSLLCLMIALLFRLNVLVIQLANLIVYPLQLLLMFPYFKLGALIFDVKLSADFTDLSALTINSVLMFGSEMYKIFLGALIIWLIFGIIVGFVIFRIIYAFLVNKLNARRLIKYD